MRRRTRRYLAYILFAGAAVLLFLGGREFIGSYLGQMKAKRDFRAERAPRPKAPPPKSPPAKSPRAKSPRPRKGETIAKLRIPRLKAELFVIEGDAPEQLRQGPGHLSDTADIGSKGNCVIAGHRDTHFRILKDIQKGDDIIIETPDGQYLYRVNHTDIVSPRNTASLKPTADGRLNLITCYPFFYVGHAPKRFVVEAQLTGSIDSSS